MSPKATRAVQDAARRIVRERDQGRCCICGAEATDIHHRRRKGMGGSALLEMPSNLVTLCGHGNASGCHGWAHQHRIRANEHGWVLYDFEVPAETPVLTYGGWYMLDDEGGRTPYTGVRCRPTPEIPQEAIDEAARAIADEYEQPAEWHRDDARRAIEAAAPVLYEEWVETAGPCQEEPAR